MKKEFVLPIQWCVQSTKETAKSIYEWLDKYKEISNTTVYSAKLLEADYIIKIHYPPCGSKHQYDYIQPGYTEITYNQFKKYVLNQQEEDFSYLDKLLSKWNIK